MLDGKMLELGFIQDTYSLIMETKIEEISEYCYKAKLITNVDEIADKLKKAKYSKASILEYIFALGMLTKERLDKANVDLKNHTIGKMQLPETLLLELSFLVDGIKKG